MDKRKEREGVGIENRPGVCVRRWGHGAGVNGGIIFAPGSWGPLSSCGLDMHMCVCVFVCVCLCVCVSHTRIYTCALCAGVPHCFTLDLCVYKKKMR